MTLQAQSVEILLLMVVVLALLGALSFFLGQRWRQGVVMGWVALFFSSVVLTLSWVGWWEHHAVSETFERGWIFPKDELGSVGVGLVRDAWGLLVGSLVVLLSAVWFWVGFDPSSIRRPERGISALLLAMSGVLLAWFSETPWLGLVGLGLTSVAGFLVHDPKVMGKDVAWMASRFGREKAWSLLLTLLGLCVLAGEGHALSYSKILELNTGSELGFALLCAGLFVQILPFPFLGWSLRAGEKATGSWFWLTQALPAWAMFSFLFRFDPVLEKSQVLTVMGWVALASVLANGWVSWAQDFWSVKLSLWGANTWALVLASLCFGSHESALILLLGGAFSQFIVAAIGSRFSQGKNLDQKGLQVILGAGYFSAIGFFGFSTGGAYLKWLNLTWAEPVLTAALALVFFVFHAQTTQLVLASWRGGRSLQKQESEPHGPWSSTLVLVLVALLTTGLVFTGTVSGGFFLQDEDQVLVSLYGLLKLLPEVRWGSHQFYAQTQLLYWSVLGLSVLTGYFLTFKKPHFWSAKKAKSPRFYSFVQSGFWVDRGSAFALDFLIQQTRWIQRVLDQFFWEEWAPSLFHQILQRISKTFSKVDHRIANWIGGSFRRMIEVPSHVVQLIQNGDAQWYLFFGLSSGVLMFMYFLRN